MPLVLLSFFTAPKRSFLLMPMKRVMHKETMAKKKSGNPLTSWVHLEFEKSDLIKPQWEGFLVGGKQVIFRSTKCIPKPPSGYRVMFLAFLLHGLSLLAHEFLRGLLSVYGV
jgi:hypothetical protein